MKIKQTRAKRETRPKNWTKKQAGRREAKKEETKRQILTAALELFREQGLDGTTTRQISKRAGIAEGTLFNYFKTKEDLALYFFQKETNDLVEWFESNARLKKAGLPEKLFAIVHRQLEYIEPYEDFIGAVFFRSLQPSSKLSPLSLESQELRVKYLRFIKDVLVEAEEKGEIPPTGDLGAYAFGLYYMGIVLHWLHDTSKGKQKTLALLDRSLNLATKVLRQGGWEW
jgi:AcrR family transcriptional regulator